MVRALHAAGIEVILDVVYNHTAEGNHLGPDALASGASTTPRYYRLAPDDPRYYLDFTGLRQHAQHATTRACCSSSWTACATGSSEMHVDGFRFDLASALARELHEVDTLGVVLRHHPAGPGALAGEADRRAVGRRRGRLPGGQLPRPAGRSGTAGTATPCASSGAATAGTVAELATRLAGSSDLYAQSGRRPYASINFVTCHDGFTLRDLVSYNDKHNEANGEDNRDGDDDNLSWNCGVEGPTDDPAILRAARAPAAQLPGHAAALAGRADARRRATSSAARSTATTTPTARTTRSAGSTGS